MEVGSLVPPSGDDCRAASLAGGTVFGGGLRKKLQCKVVRWPLISWTLPTTALPCSAPEESRDDLPPGKCH